MHEYHQDRLASLDVFRGVTIAGMVLVNNPGDWSFVYPPMRHAEWNGWTPTDLVFPFFLFIVGVSLVFALEKSLKRGQSKSSIMRRVIRRSVILFLIGLSLQLVPSEAGSGYNWFTDTLMQVRIMGVLQRIAVVYLLSSLIVLNSSPGTRMVWASGLLLFYWVAMRFIPFTVMQEGSAVTYIGALEPEANLAAYLDNLVLHGHTYVKGPYLHYDPEGILSTLPAIATGLAGTQAGVLLKGSMQPFQKTTLLFVAGCSAVILGLIMDALFPINKALWSPSYVVLTAGLASVALAMCCYVIDIQGLKSWAWPFVVFGTNPIVLYVCSELLARLTILIKVDHAGTSIKEWIVSNIFRPAFGDLNGSLAFACATILFMLLLMTPLHKRGILIRV